MFLFVNENQIKPYNGEILKRYVGDTLVKVIANPTSNDLKEFGYKELDETAEALEEKEGFFVETFYTDGDKIAKSYRYVEIPKEDELGGTE